jgi:ATP-dependent Clp protease ATP-binding subunit ClpA
MTSNAVIKKVKNIGFDNENLDNINHNHNIIYKELSKTFPIEFLNRIDEIILFNSLSNDDIKQILNKKLIDKTIERFREEGIILNFDDSSLDMLVEKGYSKELGARNIERTFEKFILSEISNYLYKINANTTNQKEITVLYKNNEIIIK